jgi:hypothetical protein
VQVPSQPSASAPHTWRYPTERVELVERLITAETRCRLLERTLREWSEHVEQDRAAGSFAAALMARIAGLEANQERLIRRREGRDDAA